MKGICVNFIYPYFFLAVTVGSANNAARQPRDSSFLTPKFTAKFEWYHPRWGRQIQVRWVKIRHFRRKTRYNSKTVQDRRIVSIKVK